MSFDAELADGWAGTGSRAPHSETLANFRLIVDSGLPIPSPHVFAEVHGTIDIEADGTPEAGRVHLSVGRTRYSMYVVPATGLTGYFEGLITGFETDRPQVLALLATL